MSSAWLIPAMAGLLQRSGAPRPRAAGPACADRLRRASVAVEVEPLQGVTHDDVKMGRVLKEAMQALDAAAATLRKALDP